MSNMLNCCIPVLCALLVTCTSRPSSGVSAPVAATLRHDSIPLNQSELTQVYCLAISDYIKAVYDKDKMVFDTLFFGKRSFGQPDDFPDITLPDSIGSTAIKLVSPEVGGQLQAERKSRIYINLIGWVDRDQASFIFVTFSNGSEHKFDCYLDYKYNSSSQSYTPERVQIEELIRDQTGRPVRYDIYLNGKYIGDKPVK